MRRILAFSVLGLLLSVAGHAQTLIYSQPSSASSTTFGGILPTAYDNFSLANSAQLSAISWSGFYNNSTTHGFERGTITQFEVSFYNDLAGKPGSLLSSSTIQGNANETLSTRTFQPTYNYSAALPQPFTAIAGSHYWISVVPSLSPPSQWAWLDGFGGDGLTYHSSAGRIGSDLTFALYVVPEPGMLPLLCLAGLLLARTRRVAR